MWIEIIKVFTIIFVAELGDKSQILAMSFAAKYKLRQVLIGVFFGIFLNHLLAVIVGSVFGAVFTSNLISYLVAAVFLSFAMLTLLDRGEETTEKQRSMTPILAISIAFFVGELGDKTQLATMAFASESAMPYVVLIGSVSAMMLVSYVGIIIGRLLGEKVPDYYIRLGSSLLFFGYGLVKLNQGYVGSALSNGLFILIVVVIVGLFFSMLFISVRQYKNQPLTTFQRVAKHLHDYYQQMDYAIEQICLGEGVCGTCLGKNCLIGHIKYLMEEAKKGHPVDLGNLSSKAFKEVDDKHLLIAIHITLDEIKDHWDDPDFIILHRIREHLDFLLFKRTLKVSSFEEYVAKIKRYQATHKL